MRGKVLVAAVIICAGVLLVALIQRRRTPSRYELTSGESIRMDLPDYGRLKLRITAAGVRIVPGVAGSAKITVNQIYGKARLVQYGSGSNAEIDIDHLGNQSFVLVEVPPHTDLDVGLNAGELKVHRVSGDKYLDVRAGRIEVANPRSEVGFVNAFVLTGRINAPAFGTDTGGIWRSRQWHGNGRSRVNLSLLAGEIFLGDSGDFEP